MLYKVKDFLADMEIDKAIFVSGQYEVRLDKDGIRHNLRDGAWNLLDIDTDIDMDMDTKSLYLVL